MKTCGECKHYYPVRNECCADIPRWVIDHIDNLGGARFCLSNNAQAEYCDCYEPERDAADHAE